MKNLRDIKYLSIILLLSGVAVNATRGALSDEQGIATEVNAENKPEPISSDLSTSTLMTTDTTKKLVQPGANPVEGTEQTAGVEPVQAQEEQKEEAPQISQEVTAPEESENKSENAVTEQPKSEVVFEEPAAEGEKVSDDLTTTTMATTTTETEQKPELSEETEQPAQTEQPAETTEEVAAPSNETQEIQQPAQTSELEAQTDNVITTTEEKPEEKVETQEAAKEEEIVYPDVSLESENHNGTDNTEETENKTQEELVFNPEEETVTTQTAQESNKAKLQKKESVADEIVEKAEAEKKQMVTDENGDTYYSEDVQLNPANEPQNLNVDIEADDETNKLIG